MSDGQNGRACVKPYREVTVGPAMSDSWGRQRLPGTAILITSGQGQQGLGIYTEVGMLEGSCQHHHFGYPERKNSRKKQL
jgi:hypothetical protein